MRRMESHGSHGPSCSHAASAQWPGSVVGEAYPDSVLATISVGGTPTDIVVLPNGERIYIGNSISNHVTVVDVLSRSV
ncbi:MAG: hypothetical protein R6X13_12010, partial [bacterium]